MQNRLIPLLPSSSVSLSEQGGGTEEVDSHINTSFAAYSQYKDDDDDDLHRVKECRMSRTTERPLVCAAS